MSQTVVYDCLRSSVNRQARSPQNTAGSFGHVSHPCLHVSLTGHPVRDRGVWVSFQQLQSQPNLICIIRPKRRYVVIRTRKCQQSVLHCVCRLRIGWIGLILVGEFVVCQKYAVGLCGVKFGSQDQVISSTSFSPPSCWFL